MNNNPLTALPPEIGRCAALRYIDASDTQLHKVPKELATLKNLVDVDLDRTLLKASQKTPYLMHGTMGLLQHLRERAERFHLKQALMETLKFSVYHEASSTDAGASMLLALVADIFEEFSDPREIRLVIRNAARLFPPLLTQATAHAVRVRHDELARDNARKQVRGRMRALWRGVHAMLPLLPYVCTLATATARPRTYGHAHTHCRWALTWSWRCARCTMTALTPPRWSAP